jgi:hypothetical protein
MLPHRLPLAVVRMYDKLDITIKSMCQYLSLYSLAILFVILLPVHCHDFSIHQKKKNGVRKWQQNAQQKEIEKNTFFIVCKLNVNL